MKYTSQDSSQPHYEDSYTVSTETMGLTPVASSGPEPGPRLTPGEQSLHKMLGRIVQSIGELRR
jgi:hypothetical protein